MFIKERGVVTPGFESLVTMLETLGINTDNVLAIPVNAEELRAGGGDVKSVEASKPDEGQEFVLHHADGSSVIVRAGDLVRCIGNPSGYHDLTVGDVYEVVANPHGPEYQLCVTMDDGDRHCCLSNAGFEQVESKSDENENDDPSTWWTIDNNSHLRPGDLVRCLSERGVGAPVIPYNLTAGKIYEVVRGPAGPVIVEDDGALGHVNNVHLEIVTRPNVEAAEAAQVVSTANAFPQLREELASSQRENADLNYRISDLLDTNNAHVEARRLLEAQVAAFQSLTAALLVALAGKPLNPEHF